MRMIEDEDVEFIRLQFTDLHGTLKNLAVTASQLERIIDNGCLFDISSVDAVADATRSERMLVPDYSTFEIFPWRPQQGKVARLLCTICLPDGTISKGDPRSILKKVTDEAAKYGYSFEVGPECEFFLFETDEHAKPTVITHEQAGYFDIGPLDEGENARRDIVLTLEDMGFEIAASHHEAAPAQHEIDLMHDEANVIADKLQTFKLAVRTMAKRHGLHATFMPKPKNDEKGSAMHINISMFKDGKNIFCDESDENRISQEGYYFIGGLLKHMPAITAVTNPLVNSYKRLVPEYAPVYMAWSSINRNQMIRIPVTRNPRNTRIELRNPDSSCNPYLALALCLAAGMDGIKNKIQPPAAIDEDISAMSHAKRKELGIKRVPRTLSDALEVFENDEFVRTILGDYAVDKYVEAKKKEWDDYNRFVSQWELNEYLIKY